MKALLLTVGATHKKWIAEGEKEYIDRLKHYVDFEDITVPDIRNTSNLSAEQQKIKEGELLISRLQTGDFVILLDERGKQFGSREFSANMQSIMNRGLKRVVFIIGGPYGFSESVYAIANQKMSLSSLTFPHDLVRVIFLEQLYRAFTILRGEKYHHD